MTLLSAVGPAEDGRIDRYLAEQADLSAVERFAQRHEAELTPRQERYYRDLIPLGEPTAGHQYAFEVDLDACTGCKACVAACHSLNGLDDGESWRSVTMLSGGTPAEPFLQTVTASCHHCVDPACLNGCPANAYEKDPVTGIVSHLDDQCIGCSYCTLTCPYEVPVFNKARGIVRKCDMCRGRLQAGEAPACVQACPNAAIAVRIVPTGGVRTDGALASGAPPSSITRPTTVYLTTKPPVAASRPATIGPARGHPPLAVMLVLTQLAVGTFLVDLAVARGRGARLDVGLAVLAAVVAVGASVLHLGRPRYCYRALLGLRHSWLSREIVAFGAFTGLAGPFALLLWRRSPVGGPALGLAAAAAGVAGVGCSVMIYATTHRSSWRAPIVTAKFGLTAAVCGVATVLWGSLVFGPPARSLPLVLAALTVTKLVVDAAALVGRGDETRRRVRLLTGELRTAAVGRLVAGVLGGVALPALLAATTAATTATTATATAKAATTGTPATAATVIAATVILVGVVAGEMLERLLFFTTASAPR